MRENHIPKAAVHYITRAKFSPETDNKLIVFLILALILGLPNEKFTLREEEGSRKAERNPIDCTYIVKISKEARS